MFDENLAALKDDLLRSLSDHYLDDITSAIDKQLSITLKKGYFASCLTCKHFNEGFEVCTIAGSAGARPPARVIAFGCPQYMRQLERPQEHVVNNAQPVPTTALPTASVQPRANLNFAAKPKPAQAAPGGSYTVPKSPIAKNLADWDDDIPF